MTSVLIGHTGFVGGTLLRQRAFDETYNSKTIEALTGRAVDEVWCAGVQAVKWWANANPEDDRAGIERLLSVLRTVRARRFVLISTVDVFADSRGVDEATPVVEEGLHPYGLHRRLVEREVAARFPDHCIVRLPGLYGTGLKKNFIHDMMVGKPVGGFHADATFQFYNLDRLSADIGVALGAGLDLVHLTTEPVTVAEIARTVFDTPFDNAPPGPRPAYDLRTRHAGLWNRTIPYLEDRAEVLAGIGAFVRQARKDAPSKDAPSKDAQ